MPPGPVPGAGARPGGHPGSPPVRPRLPAVARGSGPRGVAGWVFSGLAQPDKGTLY